MSMRRFWRRYFGRARWDGERRQEIESYIQIETDDNIARGMPRDEARLAARRKFGNTTLVREEIYRMNTISLLETVGRATRHGLRALRRNPGFASAALLTLAIGIGANTAVFSVVNSVLLRPLPYSKPEELVGIWHTAPGASGSANVAAEMRLSASMYFTYTEQNKAFQALGVWVAGTATVTGLAEPEQVRTVFLSDGTLEALSVPPGLGQWLSIADQAPGGPQNVMLSYGYWQRRFGGDQSVVGRSITVDSLTRRIAGAMPRGFRVVTADFDLLVPLAFDRGQLRLAGFRYQGIGRLQPGISISQAKADLARIIPQWIDSWPIAPGENRHDFETWGIAPDVRPLKQDVVGSLTNVLWVLMGTMGIVMLIACANVANLWLVRSSSREQELAVRAALGAGSARIVHELLTESLLLGTLGGLAGLGAAYGGLSLLAAIGPANLPRLNEISLDARAVAFTLLVSLLSGLLFGLMPALKHRRPRIANALRSAGRTSSFSRERHHARNLLATAQVALALVLLVGASLMIRTFQALRTVEPGFTQPEQLQLLRISIPESLIQDPERVARTQYDVANNLAAIPGVASQPDRKSYR